MSVDRTIAALADPTRRELLHRLSRRSCNAGDLARGFSISRPAVFKHARMLRNAGLIRAKKVGRERIYELAPHGGEAITALIRKLEEVSAFWDEALGAFKRYLEEQ